MNYNELTSTIGVRSVIMIVIEWKCCWFGFKGQYRTKTAVEACLGLSCLLTTQAHLTIFTIIPWFIQLSHADVMMKMVYNHLVLDMRSVQDRVEKSSRLLYFDAGRATMITNEYFDMWIVHFTIIIFLSKWSFCIHENN